MGGPEGIVHSEAMGACAGAALVFDEEAEGLDTPNASCPQKTAKGKAGIPIAPVPLSGHVRPELALNLPAPCTMSELELRLVGLPSTLSEKDVVAVRTDVPGDGETRVIGEV